MATSIWMFPRSIQSKLSCGHLYLDVRFHQYSKTISCGHLHLDVHSLSTVNLPGGHLYLDVRSLNTAKPVLWPPLFGFSLTQYSKIYLVATSIWMFPHSIQSKLSCGHLYLDVPSLNTVKPVLWPPLFGFLLTQYSKTCLVATSIWMFANSIQ